MSYRMCPGVRGKLGGHQVDRWVCKSYVNSPLSLCMHACHVARKPCQHLCTHDCSWFAFTWSCFVCISMWTMNSRNNSSNLKALVLLVFDRRRCL